MERICREHSISLTAQRRTVLEILPLLNHPTVDDVWEEMRKVIPKFPEPLFIASWSNLPCCALFARPVIQARWLAMRTAPTGTITCLCIRCGAMCDMDNPNLDLIEIPGKESGFTIEDYSIQFRGICHECSAKAAGQNEARKV